jgi:hypothetical protein
MDVQAVVGAGVVTNAFLKIFRPRWLCWQYAHVTTTDFEMTARIIAASAELSNHFLRDA